MPRRIIGEAADRSGWWLTHLGECPFVARIIEPGETMDGHILVDFRFFGAPPGDLEELRREAVDALEQYDEEREDETEERDERTASWARGEARRRLGRSPTN